jgi:hypothetical protein
VLLGATTVVGLESALAHGITPGMLPPDSLRPETWGTAEKGISQPT